MSHYSLQQSGDVFLTEVQKLAKTIELCLIIPSVTIYFSPKSSKLSHLMRTMIFASLKLSSDNFDELSVLVECRCKATSD